MYNTYIYIYSMDVRAYPLAGIRSEATSRFSGKPETLNVTHKTNQRLHITQAKYCT